MRPIFHPDLARAVALGLFLFFFHHLNAQNRATLSGYVTDLASGEALIGATVRDVHSGKGAITNTFGYYSLTLPAGDSVTLLVTYIGYKTEGYALLLSENQTFNMRLTENAVLQEVEIVGERYERIEERAQMSRVDVPIEQIKNVPALLGEKDVLKALQLLPGVSGGGEGQSGLYVRGGGPDQNLILLDGVPVYNASHLFGFFSVFNTDAIKDVSLIKGGFPARYGGRLSSVIDINLKEGNENEFHGEGSIGLVASRLTLEGPIKKGVSSFIVSGRRTYIDILARPVIKAAFRADDAEGTLGYFFDDLNAKVNYRISANDRIYLSLYTGRDKFYSRFGYDDTYIENGFETRYEERAKLGLGWGNRTAALRWNHVLSPRLFANTTLTYSRYRFGTSAGYESRDYANEGLTDETIYDVDYHSGINDWAARVDVDFIPNPAHYIRFGGSAIYHTFQPGKFLTRNYSFELGQDTSDFHSDYIEPDVYATEFSLYGEDDWKITERFRVNAGLHASGFLLKGNPYYSLQPRINTRYLFPGGWSAKASFSTMRQYIHLLTNENIGLPTDLWLPATRLVKPQDSWQAAIGGAKTFGDGYEGSVEVFYKEMNHVIAFREGAGVLQFQGWETRVAQGNGEAYGAEFFVQKKKGRFNGWLGYTLSWAWRQFDDINQGQRYPYKFDRRHDIELTGSYRFSPRFAVSATWVFATGNAVTLATSRYLGPAEYGDFNEFLSETEHTPERNNFRLQSSHRLDVGVEFTKKKTRYERTWSFGAYNAYNRANPFILYTEDDYDANGNPKRVLKKLALFPVIPYFSWSFKF